MPKPKKIKGDCLIQLPNGDWVPKLSHYTFNGSTDKAYGCDSCSENQYHTLRTNCRSCEPLTYDYRRGVGYGR